MKRLAWITLALVACGKNNAAKEDGPPANGDGPVDSPIDAPALGACANPVNGTTITTRLIGTANGPGQIRAPGGAMLVTAPAGDPKLYVVGKSGQIVIVDENETLLPEPFIDLSDVLASGGEAGLLGLAFHPQYHTNGQFFVFYTATQAGVPGFGFRDIVARCTRSTANPNKADPTCTEILSVRDPASNHNGGMIEFGADGFLYISTGDGGPQNDPAGSAQALVDGPTVPNQVPPAATALLGKMLRIDVDNPANGKQYGIPADNPFAGGGGAPEIFMIGFRNPWRWSFDRATGDMWIGDVGQGAIEEVSYIKAGQQNGKNLGWRMYEGSDCFSAPCDPTDKVFPVDERTHSGDGWNAVIGGQVYRGTCFPDLVGTYFYTDNGNGGLFTAKLNGDGATVTATELPGNFPTSPASIHASATGELYLGTTNGSIHRIEAAP